MTTHSNIGFIGAGSMGRPMIEHLRKAGHHVVVYARRPEAIEALRADGLAVASSPAETAANAEFVFLNVTATADVESVLFGERCVIESARPGTLVIDHSTISATASRAIAARLNDRGIRFIDAPVSGGVRGATDATLSIMIGGDAHDVQRAMPLLELLGRTITHVGGPGAGQVAKACNQIVQVVNIQGIAEAMRFAQAQDVDLSRVLSAISAGMAGSKMLDLMGPKMAQRNFAAGLPARLHAKDFKIVSELVRELGLDLPAINVVAAQLAALIQAGWGSDDTSSLLRVLESNQRSV